MERSKLLVNKHSKTPLKAIYLTILLISGLCLSLSLFAEFSAHLRPCNLCLAQRYVYIALIALSFLGYLFKFEHLACKVSWFVLCLGFCIAGYQSLAYFGFIKAKCSTNPDFLLNLAELKKGHIQAPDCSSQMFSVLGVPACVASALIYLFIAWLLSQKRPITKRRGKFLFF